MKKSENNFLEKSFRFLVYSAPVILFFSYYPAIFLGSNSSINFELSLPLVWLVVFDLNCFVLLLRKHLFGNIMKLWPWLLFPVFLTISILWSSNILRGILVIGILWLIYFAGFAISKLKDLLMVENFRNKFYKIFFGSTIVVCAWCFLQSILDVLGISRDVTLMCNGCVYNTFGFPHPNGFAIEPQFMGNLLLAPTIVAIWLLIKKSDDKMFKNSTLIILIFVFSATLFLTFSRGAIYAFVVAISLLLSITITKQKSARSLLILPIIFMAFLLTLCFQGLMTEIGPTDETFYSGVAKSLNQLSLGIIDIRKRPELERVEEIKAVEENTAKEDDHKEKATFDGYVESSTAIRINLNDFAIEIWAKNLKNKLFGIGLGGSGVALYENEKIGSPKEIIHNQFFSLLLETGLIGIGLLILTIVLIVRSIVKTKVVPLMYALIIAYSVTLCFFAGLPNALHIYLMPVLLFYVENSRRLK